MRWAVGALFLMLFLALNKSSEEKAFDRSHVGIFFEPFSYIQHSTGSNLINELAPPLSKISAEFSKISLRLNNWELPKISFVPAAIASFNKDYLEANESHLEVTIFIMKSDSVDESINPTVINLDIATKAADEANKIYPGTVKRIIIEHIDYILEKEEMQVHKFEAYLANAAILKAGFTYELGASIPLVFCKDDGLPQVLKHIQHISFSYLPIPVIEFENFSQFIANLTGEELSKSFDECQQIIEDYGKNITIQVVAGWSTVHFTGIKFDPKQSPMKYWENLNDLAIETNTTVVFDGIFETERGTLTTVWDYQGWRQLDEIPVKIAKHFENHDVAEDRNVKVIGDNSQSPESWGSRLTIFITCVIIAVAFAVIFKKCDKYATMGVQPRCW